MTAGVVLVLDSLDSPVWNRVHQVGAMEQHKAGHVPGGALQMPLRAAQGSPVPQVSLHQGKPEACLIFSFETLNLLRKWGASLTLVFYEGKRVQATPIIN